MDSGGVDMASKVLDPPQQVGLPTGADNPGQLQAPMFPSSESSISIVDLDGHCTICLRSSKETLLSDTESSCSLATRVTITSFKHLWPYLQPAPGPSAILSQYLFKTGEVDEDGDEVISGVPPLCSECYEAFLPQLEQLHQEFLEVKARLKGHALKVRKAVTARRNLHSFLERIRLMPCRNDVADTTKFVNLLRNGVNTAVLSDEPEVGVPTQNIKIIKVVRKAPASCHSAVIVTRLPSSEHHRRARQTPLMSEVSRSMADQVRKIGRLSRGDTQKKTNSTLPCVTIEDESCSGSDDSRLECEERGEYTKKTFTSEAPTEVSAPRSPGRKRKKKLVVSEAGADVPGWEKTRLLLIDKKPPIPLIASSLPPSRVQLGQQHPPRRLGQQQKCDVCENQIPMEEVNNHVQKHVGYYAVKCFACPYTSVTFQRLKQIHLSRAPSTSQCHLVLQKMLDEYWQCETCGFKANSTIVLKKHSERHETHEKNMKCPLCEEKFTTKQNVALHLNVHLKSCGPSAVPKWLKCELCPDKLAMEEMEKHINSKHPGNEVLRCKQCCFACVSREDTLIPHMTTHSLEGMVCDICELKFSRLAHLRDHYLCDHQIGKKFLCEACDDKESYFYTKKSLARHHRLTHTEEGRQTSLARAEILKKKRFHCLSCSARFHFEDHLVTHRIRKHGAERLKCDLCPKMFDVRKVLIAHKQAHAGIVTQTLECDMCDKSFECANHLTAHRDAVHLKRRRYVCDVESCRQAFSAAPALVLHKKKRHLGLRPNVCDQCGMAFFEKVLLKQHYLRHTKERPFSCQLCGQKFRQKVSFQTHLKSHQKNSQFKPGKIFDRKLK